jgi:hypothetical protein
VGRRRKISFGYPSALAPADEQGSGDRNINEQL